MKFDDISGGFEPCPEGNHIGILVSYIDRGLQDGTFGPRRQVFLKWELPGVETDNENQVLVFQTIFNLSLRAKAFSEIVAALMGSPSNLRGVNIKDMLGKAARLTIVHNENGVQTYANIDRVRPLKPGEKVPVHETELTYFSLDQDEFDEAVFESLPKSEKDRIVKSETYKDLMVAKSLKNKRPSAIIKDSLPGEAPWDDAIPNYK
jgi:hypothetical protein